MTTLAEGLVRVRKLVDDVKVKKYDDTLDITPALMTGQGEAWTCALGSSGKKYFKLTVAKSSSGAGVVDLSNEKPRKIIAVSHIQSGGRLFVMPARMEEGPIDYTGAATPLSIVYLPDVTFPTAPGNPFVWAAAAAMPSLVAQLDQLMCLLAAAELKPIENEKTAGLAERIEAKKLAIEDAFPSTSWSSIPLDELAASRRNRAAFRYIETGPHALQLVMV